MTWDILKTNINKYANDFNSFHTRDDVLTKSVTEITNFVNTNTKTFSGNSIYINPAPLLSGLKSVDKILETITMETFDVDISNINIEKDILDIINNNSSKLDIPNIEDIPEFLRNQYEFFKNFDVESLRQYPDKIMELPDRLISLGFSLLDFNFLEFPNMNIDQVISILNNMKDKIFDEVKQKLFNGDVIKIPLDYGVVLDIPIINTNHQEQLQDLITGLIQDKFTLDIMLSNPLMDFNKIVELFPKIDIKESIENLELPDVDMVVSVIMKKSLDFMISSAMITPIQSALPGGVPMSEQIISTGFGGGINLSSGNLFDELLKMLETQLKTATIVNVSSYNGVITPVTGVGIT